MKLFIAVLGFFLFTLANAQPHCDVYLASAARYGGQNGKLWKGNKTLTEPYLLRDSPELRFRGIAYDKLNRKLFYSTWDRSNVRGVRAMASDGTDDSILPSNTDVTLGGEIAALALDTETGRIFGGDGDYILMGPSDGSNPLERVSIGSFGITDLVYDPATNKMYFTTGEAIWVTEMPVNETPTEAVELNLNPFDSLPPKLEFNYYPPSSVRGIDIDTANGYLYWTASGRVPSVFRVPSDGSGLAERLYTFYDFGSVTRSNYNSMIPDRVRIDEVNQILYITTERALYIARADGMGKPQVLYDMDQTLEEDASFLTGLALDCDGSRDGLPLLSHCSTDKQCFLNGVCTGRVGKPKKCRFCARKNQSCKSDDECCQSPTGRYCHPVKKVCKRRPKSSKDDILDFVQCPTGTAYSSIADTGTRLDVSDYTPLSRYDRNEEYATQAVSLPFDFPWFGTKVNKTYVRHSGLLAMEETGSLGPILLGGPSLPRISVINGVYAQVYMQQSTKSVTFSWEGGGYVICSGEGPYCRSSGDQNSQITVFDDGRVVLCWGNMQGRTGYLYDPNLYLGIAYGGTAGLEDDSLGYAKPAVMFPDNPFDEFGEIWNTNPSPASVISGRCACFG